MSLRSLVSFLNGKKVLLTGFEPDLEHDFNPSWEAVRVLEGKNIDGYEVHVMQLPTVFDKASKVILSKIQELKPQVVVSFGHARQGEDHILVETQAKNRYAMDEEDNEHKKPPREEVVPKGPKQIPVTLPVEKVLESLRSAGFAVRSSKDAGGHLCNEILYRMLHLGDKAPKVVGFIHVPYLRTEDPRGGTYDSEKLAKAVAAVVKTVVGVKNEKA